VPQATDVGIFILVQKIHAKPLWSKGAKNTVEVQQVLLWLWWEVFVALFLQTLLILLCTLSF